MANWTVIFPVVTCIIWWPQWHVGSPQHCLQFCISVHMLGHHELHQAVGVVRPYIFPQHPWTACPLKQHLLTGWGRSLLLWVTSGCAAWLCKSSLKHGWAQWSRPACTVHVLNPAHLPWRCLFFLWSNKNWSTINVQLRVDCMAESRQIALNTVPLVRVGPISCTAQPTSFPTTFVIQYLCLYLMYFQFVSFQIYFLSDKCFCVV